jgi:hypothetical protein
MCLVPRLLTWHSNLFNKHNFALNLHGRIDFLKRANQWSRYQASLQGASNTYSLSWFRFLCYRFVLKQMALQWELLGAPVPYTSVHSTTSQHSQDTVLCKITVIGFVHSVMMHPTVDMKICSTSLTSPKKRECERHGISLWCTLKAPGPFSSQSSN